MKRLSLVLGALLLGLFVAAPTVQAAPAATAFTGEWIGEDPAPPDGDGSTVHLFVSGGDHPRVEFTDEFGTVCEDVGSPVTVFFLEHASGIRRLATRCSLCSTSRSAVL